MGKISKVRILPRMLGIDDASGSDSSIEIAPPDGQENSSDGELSTSECSDLKKQDVVKPIPTVSSRQLFTKRPGYGSNGQKIRLVANYFEMKIMHSNVYHYDVEIIPIKRIKDEISSSSKKYRCLNSRINREVINVLQRTSHFFKNCRLAYDGRKNLYTATPLPLEGSKKFIVPVISNGTSNDYKIVIKPVCKNNQNLPIVSLEPLHQVLVEKSSYISEEAITALDTILRHGPALHLTPIGRCFFYKSNQEEQVSLGGGLEIWFGYHQSVRLSQWKPMLNVDTSATAFYQHGPLLKFVEEVLHIDVRRVKEFTDAQVRIITKELKALKICVNHLPYKRQYRINAVTREPAHSLYFRLDDDSNHRISVANYFRQKYQELRFPNLPCVRVGSVKKPSYLPVEICELISGQHCKKKLNERQVAEMIKHTSRAPQVRFRNIMNAAKQTITDSASLCNDFDITINPQMVQLDGRILQPPAVMYHQQQEIQPCNGVWDMRGKRFYKGVKISIWSLISLSTSFCRETDLKTFARMLCEGGRRFGMDINEVSYIRSYSPADGSVERIVKKVVKRCSGVQLIIVVLPSKLMASVYSDVKDVAEIKLGLITQCIKDTNATGKKCSQQLICNVCQKINAKLGGINNCLSPSIRPAVMDKPVIFIGADCSHPSPGDRIKYSIAALVGSLDNYPSRYAASVRLQISGLGKRAEIIQDTKDMMQDLLLAFYRHTRGKKPEKIVYFRDGLSEGEYSQAINTELRLIRKACADMNPSEVYQPPITFIVVGKRHHTRFMPEDYHLGVGKNYNIPPGTVVDTGIIHPTQFDFYICSHTSIQGTSRPAHYVVLWDDSNFSVDDLQKMSYYLCHTYVRCTRSISIPCPVMYAHLAAYRAKQHLVARYEEMTSSSSDSASASESSTNQIQYNFKCAIQIDSKLKNSMYFV